MDNIQVATLGVEDCPILPLAEAEVAVIVVTFNPRISDKGRIGQGSDQDLAELARYTRFSMWKCGSEGE